LGKGGKTRGEKGRKKKKGKGETYGTLTLFKGEKRERGGGGEIPKKRKKKKGGAYSFPTTYPFRKR